MGALSQFFAGIPSAENPKTPLNAPASWLMDAFGAHTSSGQVVNSETAMRISTVFRCMSLIVNTIASLPWGVHQHTDTGSEPFPKHNLHRRLRSEPNDTHSSYTFRQHLVTPILMSGDGYAIIDRKRGAPDKILTVPARDAQKVVVVPRNNRLEYTFTFPDGKETLDQVDVLHIPGLGFDGIKGLSVISANANAIGLAMSLEEYAVKIAGSSTLARGIVEIPGSMHGKADRLKNVRDSLQKLFSGEGFAVPLDSGMTWKSLTNLNPVDAQILEQRRFSVEDICRIFGVWPWMVGETTKTTSWGTGLEQQNLAFVTYVLRSWLVSIEQEFNRKLFQWPYFCEFNVAGLLRGDSKTRAEFYQSAIRNSWMKPNEVRKYENLPADPAGDRLLADQTLIPLESLGKVGENVD